MVYSKKAQVAELVDAYASGAYGSNLVKVQVLSWAQFRHRWRLLVSVGQRPPARVDAYASGAYGSNPVEVQVLSWAQFRR